MEGTAHATHLQISRIQLRTHQPRVRLNRRPQVPIRIHQLAHGYLQQRDVVQGGGVVRQRSQALAGCLARVVEFLHVAEEDAEVIVELRHRGAAAGVRRTGMW